MNQLFKLKKAEKLVGYLKIVDGRVLLNPIGLPGYWCAYDGHLSKNLFDTAHPFVCKDKNDKDVFHADYILAEYACGEKKKAQVYWDASAFRFFWVFGEPPEQYLKCPAAGDWEDIELIEEP